MQVFNDRNNDEYIEEMKSIELVRKAINIFINVEHD